MVASSLIVEIAHRSSAGRVRLRVSRLRGRPVLTMVDGKIVYRAGAAE